MICTALIAAAMLAVDPPEWVVHLDQPTHGSAFAVSPDGGRFVVARDTNWLDIYAKGELEYSVRCNDGDRVIAVSFAPDGKSFAVGCENASQLRLWAIPHIQPNYAVTANAGGIRAIAFSPDGSRIYTGGPDGFIFAIEPKTGATLSRLIDRPAEGRFAGTLVSALAAHPSGRFLASGSANYGSIHFWHIASSRRERDFRHLAVTDTTALAFSPSGRALLIPRSNAVQAIEVAGRGHRWSKSTAQTATSLAWSPDGRCVAFTFPYGPLEVCDGNDGTLLAIHRERPIGFLAVAATPRKIVALAADQTVRYYDWPKSAATKVPEPIDDFPLAIASNDPRAAFEAILVLSSDPDRAIALASKGLRPVRRPEAVIRTNVARLVRELGDDDFEKRQSATTQLRDLAPRAGLEIVRAYAAATDPEAAYRLQQLLTDPKIAQYVPTLTIAETRWLEILERANTLAARDLVKSLTEGDPDAELTLDAIDTLARMNRVR